MSAKTKAIIYCRVSSKKQVADGHGLDSREVRCREYARDKGDEVSGGGDFMKRPGMVKLLQYLDEHSENERVVIFEDLKRYARDTVFHLKLRIVREVLPIAAAARTKIAAARFDTLWRRGQDFEENGLSIVLPRLDDPCKHTVARNRLPDEHHKPVYPRDTAPLFCARLDIELYFCAFFEHSSKNKTAAAPSHRMSLRSQRLQG